jgi:hypothetical protein
VEEGRHYRYRATEVLAVVEQLHSVKAVRAEENSG